MEIPEKIKDYILSGQEPYFDIGIRSNLRYIASDYDYASIMDINPNGIDPIEYLYFAKADIHSNDLRGSINSISNSKRAIHLLIDCFLEILGLKKSFGKLNFPQKLEIISNLDAFPTEILDDLNKKRNIIEHEYKSIEIYDAKNFVEITEMFLLLCYPFLKKMVIGMHVGFKHDDGDFEVFLNPYKSCIMIFENKNSSYIETSIGKVYYNFSVDEKDKNLLNTIELKKSNFQDWLQYLNPLIYFTKKILIPENPIYDPKNYQRLMTFSIRSLYPADKYQNEFDIDDKEILNITKSSS